MKVIVIAPTQRDAKTFADKINIGPVPWKLGNYSTPEAMLTLVERLQGMQKHRILVIVSEQMPADFVALLRLMARDNEVYYLRRT